ncbi:unnamed protein product [Hydatigera taeniaeformis]|uniref:Protein kinase domain-containing protein n=1 Tax=Hydatigena taeniaeformis TaxID=6205 RepID=A0A0R3X0V7_HYDTA|nr:unnamed protein product [Hydatigera taeniaeformis]
MAPKFCLHFTLQHEHRSRRQSASHAERQPEQKVVSMRSIEVSASESSNTTIVTEPTVHWTEYVTKVCKPTSETALHTTCLQTTCEETNHIPPSNEVANPLIVMRVGRVETAAWPTTSRSWAGSGYSPQQCTSVVSVFSNLNVSTPKHVNWENKSTSPFTILHTFSEEFEKKVEKRPSVGDSSYLYHNDSDPTRPSAGIYLESDTYLQQSDDSMLVESECFYEPINKKLPCRESQNECPSRSSQSTPVCIARCQSFVASRSSKNSINECDSGKVNSKLTLTQIRSDLQDDGSSLKDEESKLNLSPDEKTLVTKTVAQLPLSPTPGHQWDRDGAEGQGEKVQKKSPVGRRKHSAIKTAPAFERSSMKLAVRTPPSVVFRRNRDIANGVQSPLSPHPVEIKKRISSLDELPTALHINIKEGGKFIQPVNRTGSYLQHRKWSLGGRLYPPRDVDSSGDFGEPIQLTVVPLVKNSVNMLPEDIYKIRTNSTPVKRGSNTQDLQEKCKTLDSFTDTVTPATQPISNAPPGDIREKKCTLSTSVGKPVAKVQPSTVPQGGRNFVESNKIKAIPSVKSHAIYFNSNVNGTKKVQLQEQVDTKEISGETSTSVKVNGLAKPTEEISTMEKTSNSKNHKISFKVTKDFETSSSNSTQSLATSVSDGPEKGLIQIVSPTIQDSQAYAVETQRKPSQISSESTLQVAFQNEGSSVLCYPKINVSRLPQTKVKQQESLNKAPLSRDPPAASILSSRPSDLQPSDQVGKRNQTTPTSSTGQHFFPKTHQVPQLSTGTITANHGRGVREDVDDLQEDTLKSSRTSTLTPSSASPIRPTKLTRGVHVTKRPQTARMLRTDESEKDFFLIPADTHKNAKPEDHFTIFEDIGNVILVHCRGKFGKVMRCENKQTHKIMAMKEIKTDRLPRHVSGDIMEVAVLRAIGRHDNIACFFSAYEVQHACFIITEYVCGGALYDRVVAEDNLDEKISASIIRQMLLGLEHIQACSVLHLDLKPENVMMVAPSGYQLKIIDFGLAYFYDPKRPRRQMGGTYIYSAPETINYDYQSFATDIWSVGVIAYELLSGITPFECPQSGDLERELTLPEITTNILNCRYNFDDDGICDASDKAKDFIRTILKKNPKDRPSVEACLKHPWMEMSDELPTVRRAVSIRRRASVGPLQTDLQSEITDTKELISKQD